MRKSIMKGRKSRRKSKRWSQFALTASQAELPGANKSRWKKSLSK